jgi:hypothetical protein
MPMLDGALDVETVARPAARSPDDRAGLAYLAASGATAITITEHDGVCAFRLGSKIDPRAVMVQWLPETNAREIVKQARRDAGRSPDAATAGRALAQAAADHGAVLTPHAAAMARAGDAAARLNSYMDSLRGTGRLREFTRTLQTAALGGGIKRARLHVVRDRRVEAAGLAGPAVDERRATGGRAKFVRRNLRSEVGAAHRRAFRVSSFGQREMFAPCGYVWI